MPVFLFLLSSSKCLVTQVWFIFQVSFMALGWYKFNPGPTTVKNIKIPSQFITAMNQLCCPNVIVLTTTKNMTIPNGIFSKKRACIFYIWISIAYYPNSMKFVSLQNNQVFNNWSQWIQTRFIHFEEWSRYYGLWCN